MIVKTEKANKKLIFLHQSETVMEKRYFFIFMLSLGVMCAVAQPVTITPPSANIQPGESVTLTASGAMYYRWSPDTGLSTTEGPVTVASPTVTTTYTCSGYAPGDESVVNSNFDQGNVGFTSDYTFSDNLYPEGTYGVGSNARAFHPDFIGTGHGGSGNFMIVNGSTSPNTNVWTEQITVVPNTYYAFSTWVCTVSAAGDVARLQFSINGNQLGAVFSAPPYTDQWLQFYELWYSENNTAATITILNQNTSGSGNDFGLDDISFCELVLVGAPQCTVSVGSMSTSATADDTELCEGESTTLHALPVNGSGNYTYNWTPANTLDNPTAQHPMATPNVGTTTYYCHIVDVDWNNSQDVNVEITVYPSYDETTIDTAICSSESYNFFGTSFDHSVSNHPHTLQTIHGCDSIVRLNLTVYPPNDTIIVDPNICVGQSYDFHGTLYNQNGQIAYFDTIDNHGCLKVEKLILTVGEYQMPPVQEEYICYRHDESPYFRWEKNGAEYHNDTIDEVILPDLVGGGCDFKYRLDLKFHKEFYEDTTVYACDEYPWPVSGETYTSTQQIVKTFQQGFGNTECDSTYVLNLNLKYSPSPNKIHPSPNSPAVWSGVVDPNVDDTAYVVTNTEFFSFQYTFRVKESKHDTTECLWNRCKWSINKPSWAIDTIPGGVKIENDTCFSDCTVYVAERDEDYVILTAIISNGCDSIQRKIYLKSSFLGMDENNSAAAKVSIVPNPNKGQMALHFENMEGKVEVKVYDVTGNLIDSFVTYNDTGTNIFEYDMNGPKGLYFIVANGREGTIAKKVVIR